MNKPDTVSVWTPYKPDDDAPWNTSRVVHLHRRAGFAASWSVIERDLKDGHAAAIDRLLAGQTRDEKFEAFENLSRTISDAAIASSNPFRLKAWWLFRMLLTPDPLCERLTLMWHNHFSTSNRKVENLVWMREQNELMRMYARAPFAQLLSAVVKHPAMLTWLDGNTNRNGSPNENLSRELLELFTLGVGNFSEADVKEAARALTGWSVAGEKFVFQSARHDADQKTILGKQAAFNGDDLLEILTAQPASARRIAWRICQTLMGENVVDEEAISELAEDLRAHELDLNWGVETVLRSRLFFSTQNIRSRVLGPMEYMIGALKALELTGQPPSTLLLAEWGQRMGLDLFYPPNVGGWNEGRSWLGSRNVVARANFADALVEGLLWHPLVKPSFEGLLERHGVDKDLAGATNFLAILLWGEADPAIVEPIVKQVQQTHSKQYLNAVVLQLLACPEHQLG